MRPIFVAMLCVLFANASYAQTSNTEKADPSRKRIELLIEQLASGNDAPTVRGNARRGEDQTISFPKNYDENLQVAVYCAVKALLAEEDVAVDVLLEHLEDARYSYSVNSYKDYNVSVGDACKNIATAMLIGFEDELHVVSRSQFGVFPPREDPIAMQKNSPSLLDYWRINRRLGIPKIQIQAIDAMVEYFKNADAETALPWHPDATPLETHDFNRLRDENIKTLTAIRGYIKDTGKRYRTNQIEGAHDCVFGLPWSRRQFNK